MTYIGSSIFIQGEITSAEDLQIDGGVHGQIVVRDAELTVGPGARIEAEVRSARVTVRGAVLGNISATERIELAATAEVTGDLSANFVVLAEGARFNGRIDMDRRTIASRVARFKADTTTLAGPPHNAQIVA